MLSSLQTAYAALQTQYKQEEERSRELRERYNSVNREFVELRGRCGALFESLEANRREGQGEGAELVRVRKELLLCRENLERSRANETALTSKLAEATRAVKDRLSRL
jgi:chromosome segregation ATPase